MAELKPYRGEYYLWQYVPKRAAAIIFLLFFLAMTALVAYRMYKSKTWFCTPFVVGGFCKLQHLELVIAVRTNTKTNYCVQFK